MLKMLASSVFCIFKHRFDGTSMLLRYFVRDVEMVQLSLLLRYVAEVFCA
jgi:hypothetical protein